MQPERLTDLDRLHRTYRPALIRYFSRRTGSHVEAEDLTQEVFVRLADSKETSVRSAEAYLFRVATNLLRDRSRREKVRADYRARVGTTEGLGVDPLDPHRITVGHDSLKLLHAGLAELPEKTRRIFILYRIENIAKQTIADRFGICKSSVEKHVSRAMGFLIDWMGDRR